MSEPLSESFFQTYKWVIITVVIVIVVLSIGYKTGMFSRGQIMDDNPESPESSRPSEQTIPTTPTPTPIPTANVSARYILLRRVQNSQNYYSSGNVIYIYSIQIYDTKGNRYVPESSSISIGTNAKRISMNAYITTANSLNTPEPNVINDDAHWTYRTILKPTISPSEPQFITVDLMEPREIGKIIINNTNLDFNKGGNTITGTQIQLFNTIDNFNNLPNPIWVSDTIGITSSTYIISPPSKSIGVPPPPPPPPPLASGILPNINLVEPYSISQVLVRYIRLKRVFESSAGNQSINLRRIWLVANNMQSQYVDLSNVNITMGPNLSTGMSTSLTTIPSNLRNIVSPNHINTFIEIDLGQEYNLWFIRLFPSSQTAAQALRGIDIELFNATRKPVASKLSIITPTMEYNAWYLFTSFLRQNLTTNLSGRYITLRRIDNEPFNFENVLSIRQLAVYNNQGQRYVQQKQSTGTLFPTKYLQFYRNANQFLKSNFGSIQYQFDQTNGMTITTLIRIDGNIEDEQCIFESGTDENFIYCGIRSGRILFSISLTNGSSEPTNILGGQIVIGEWTFITVRYTYSSGNMEIVQNGTVVSSGTISSTPFRTWSFSSNTIGTSVWRDNTSLNGSIAGIIVCSLPLSNTELESCYSRLQGNDISIPTPAVNLISTTLALNDLQSVSNWSGMSNPKNSSTGLISLNPFIQNTEKLKPIFNKILPIPMIASMTDIYDNNSTNYGSQYLYNGNILGRDTQITRTNSTDVFGYSNTPPIQYIRYDLGESRPIRKIVIYNKIPNGEIDTVSISTLNYDSMGHILGTQLQVSNNTDQVLWSQNIQTVATNYVYDSVISTGNTGTGII